MTQPKTTTELRAEIEAISPLERAKAAYRPLESVDALVGITKRALALIPDTTDKEQ